MTDPKSRMTAEREADTERMLDAWHADERSRWPRADVDAMVCRLVEALAELDAVRAERDEARAQLSDLLAERDAHSLMLTQTGRERDAATERAEKAECATRTVEALLRAMTHSHEQQIARADSAERDRDAALAEVAAIREAAQPFLAWLDENYPTNDGTSGFVATVAGDPTKRMRAAFRTVLANPSPAAAAFVETVRAEAVANAPGVNVVAVPEEGVSPEKWLRIGPAGVILLMQERDAARAEGERAGWERCREAGRAVCIAFRDDPVRSGIGDPRKAAARLVAESLARAIAALTPPPSAESVPIAEIDRAYERDFQDAPRAPRGTVQVSLRAWVGHALWLAGSHIIDKVVARTEADLGPLSQFAESVPAKACGCSGNEACDVCKPLSPEARAALDRGIEDAKAGRVVRMIDSSQRVVVDVPRIVTGGDGGGPMGGHQGIAAPSPQPEGSVEAWLREALDAAWTLGYDAAEGDGVEPAKRGEECAKDVAWLLKNEQWRPPVDRELLREVADQSATGAILSIEQPDGIRHCLDESDIDAIIDAALAARRKS